MDSNETMMDYLILNGAMEVSGITEDGSFLYTFTEKLEELAPEVHEKVAQAFFSELMLFWELGFIEGDLSDPDPKITLTSKCFSPEAREVLNEMQSRNLDLIIKAFRKDS